MRVLMTGDTLGRVWTFALDLAQQLSFKGTDVLLATMGREPSSAQREQASLIPNLRLAPSRYKLEWMDNPWEDIEASALWVLQLERQFAPDVIHLNTFGHGSLPFGAPVILTAHSCALSWWSAVKRRPLSSTWDRYRAHVRASLKAADLITASSRRMLDKVVEHYGPDLPPLRMVPNGRPVDLFYTAAKEPMILAAGRLWDEAKNVAALTAAGSVPWPIYLAGESRPLEDTAGQTRGCRRLGVLAPETLAAWYARSAIYALPARYEPFGLSVLEAALSGCALALATSPRCAKSGVMRQSSYRPPTASDSPRRSVL